MRKVIAGAFAAVLASGFLVISTPVANAGPCSGSNDPVVTEPCVACFNLYPTGYDTHGNKMCDVILPPTPLTVPSSPQPNYDEPDPYTHTHTPAPSPTPTPDPDWAFAPVPDDPTPRSQTLLQFFVAALKYVSPLPDTPPGGFEPPHQ